jgi:hypothetical protein
MSEEKGLGRYVWAVMVVLALFLMVVGLMAMFVSADRVGYWLEMSGSSLTVEGLDEGAVTALSFVFGGGWMLSGWVYLGVFGLFCAWGVKRKEGFAWRLGVLWGVLLTAYGIILVVEELFVLGWSSVCPGVPVFLIVGVVGLGCLLAVRKEFS